MTSLYTKNKLDLIRLWDYISLRRKKQFWLLLILMIIASLTEIISVGAILPFLGAITAPEKLYQHELMQPLINILNVENSDQLIFPFTVIFITAAMCAGLVRLSLLYVMTRLSFGTGADLSIDIYRRTLYQDFSVHTARNSSEVINGIITKTNTVIHNIIMPILTLISSTVLFIGIMSILFTINTFIALVSFIGFGALYWLMALYTRAKLKNNSKCIAEQSTSLIKSLQEGLGGIRDVLLEGNQEFYCKIYQDADIPLRRAAGDNLFISLGPRYVMEAIGMTLIAILAYFITQGEDSMEGAIPVLGALALGAQRLLPILQQAYSAFSSIRGNMASFEDVLKLLNQKLPSYVEPHPAISIPFENSLKTSELSFRHSIDSPWIFKNLNLKLPKGAKVGFVGPTGSGKSTLLDIAMGLLTPTSGALYVDDLPIEKQNIKAWQSHIAHVPQHIFLSDGTIEENIAFGIPKELIDPCRVQEAAQKAQLLGLIDDLKDGYQTLVGESGSRLSGGQRQRIGIARAMYKQADVLIFDEATSALDNETEREVMSAINSLDHKLTIFIIAHRVETLKECDMIVKLENNNIHVVSYQDIVSQEG